VAYQQTVLLNRVEEIAQFIRCNVRQLVRVLQELRRFIGVLLRLFHHFHLFFFLLAFLLRLLLLLQQEQFLSSLFLQLAFLLLLYELHCLLLVLLAGNEEFVLEVVYLLLEGGLGCMDLVKELLKLLVGNGLRGKEGVFVYIDHVVVKHHVELSLLDCHVVDLLAVVSVERECHLLQFEGTGHVGTLFEGPLLESEDEAFEFVCVHLFCVLETVFLEVLEGLVQGGLLLFESVNESGEGHSRDELLGFGVFVVVDQFVLILVEEILELFIVLENFSDLFVFFFGEGVFAFEVGRF